MKVNAKCWKHLHFEYKENTLELFIAVKLIFSTYVPKPENFFQKLSPLDRFKESGDSNRQAVKKKIFFLKFQLRQERNSIPFYFEVADSN